MRTHHLGIRDSSANSAKASRGVSVDFNTNRRMRRFVIVCRGDERGVLLCRS